MCEMGTQKTCDAISELLDLVEEARDIIGLERDRFQESFATSGEITRDPAEAKARMILRYMDAFEQKAEKILAHYFGDVVKWKKA